MVLSAAGRDVDGCDDDKDVLVQFCLLHPLPSLFLPVEVNIFDMNLNSLLSIFVLPKFPFPRIELLPIHDPPLFISPRILI